MRLKVPVDGPGHGVQGLGEDVVQQPQEDAGIVSSQLAQVKVAEGPQQHLREKTPALTMRSVTPVPASSLAIGTGATRCGQSTVWNYTAAGWQGVRPALSSDSSGAARFMPPATVRVVLMARSFQS